MVAGGRAPRSIPSTSRARSTRLRRRLVERPRTTCGASRCAGAPSIAVGVLFALEPDRRSRSLGLLLGAYLVYFGSGRAALLLERRDTAAAEGTRGAGASFARAALAGVVVAAATS